MAELGRIHQRESIQETDKAKKEMIESESIAWIIAATVVLTPVIGIYIISLFENRLYEKSNNPYRRTCRFCNSLQVMYESNVIGEEGNTWWEEHDPGNDPDCKCHRHVSDRQF